LPRPLFLEPGDRLSRDEFERRYEGMPELKKAELLEGVVHMPSPVRWNRHAGPHADLITWLGVYRASTPGVRVGDNGSLRLDLDSEPQPDAAMIIDPGHGGNVRLSADDYVEGGPEFIGEIASSSVNIDLNTKLRVYRRNQVQEYLVWRVLDQEIDWFVLRQSDYERLVPGTDGHLRSEVFPGLWLDPAALIRLDLAAVLQVLQQGLASPEHAAFVAHLHQAAARS
jgi:Uma2 family endonuclease